MKNRISNDFRRFISKIASGGISDQYNFAQTRNIILTNLFSAFSALLFLSLAISAFLREEYSVSAVFFVITFFALLNIIILRAFSSCSFSSGFLIILLNLSAIYAILFGGIDDTGILMVFILPPILIFLRGSRTGGILLLIMTGISIAILFFIDPRLILPHYSVPMKVVFMVCFVSLSVFSFLHEISREYMEKQLESAASHDSLTGLFNRREMNRILKTESLRSQRYKRPFSLIMCDIDHFKKINDVYGHKFGDTVLQMIADVLVKTTRSQDFISRWGGEEFIILLPETELNGALVAAERLRSRIAEESIIFGKEEVSVTMSFGVGEFDPGFSIEENIEKADKAMYVAKRSNRNCIKKAADGGV